MNPVPHSVVFFDIGGTLGSVRLAAGTRRLAGLDVFPSVEQVLQALRASGIRLGIISNRGSHNAAAVRTMLEEAGLLHFFDDSLIIFGAKTSSAIFRRAARQADLVASPERCLYVGEDPAERDFAAAAGLRVAESPRAARAMLGLERQEEEPVSSTNATTPANETTAENNVTTSSTAEDLAQAARALAQAAQALATTVGSLSQALQQGMANQNPVLAAGGAAGAVAAQINTWEDDPYSEAVATANPPLAPTGGVNQPVNNNQQLQTSIMDPRPAPGRYNPGTADFRYWVAEEALARGINFWAPLLPAGTRWSTMATPMRVTLVAGQRLNANYSRVFGLRFYQQTVRTVTIASAESPDVVLHELGHAILDALQPPLFNAASLEVAAFHEAFGDMSSILGAFQVPALRQKVLAETQGRLNVNSRLSRVAEQLGWGIRQLSPTAVDRDSLRNAANRFFYQRPALLPPSAPASALSSAAHSFSRVFTGAFLDALDGMVDATGPATEASVLLISRDLGQLLVDGILTAPITSGYFSSVAASMIQADQVRNQGRYRTALTRAFMRHGILSVGSVNALAAAPLPALVPAQAVAAAEGANIIGFGAGGTGARMLLAYDGGDSQDYAHGYGETRELPVRTISSELGVALAAHIPDEPLRFDVAPSPTLPGSEAADSPGDDARHFVEDLFQLGRVKVGAMQNIAPSLVEVTAEEDLTRTHTIEAGPDAPVLKRLHFDCGLCRA